MGRTKWYQHLAIPAENGHHICIIASGRTTDVLTPRGTRVLPDARHVGAAPTACQQAPEGQRTKKMLSKTQLIEKLVASSDGLSKKGVREPPAGTRRNCTQGAQEVRGVRRPWPREVRRGQEAGDQGEEGHQSLHEGADGVQGQAGAQGAQDPGGQGRQGRAPLVRRHAAFRCTQVGSSHLRAATGTLPACDRDRLAQALAPRPSISAARHVPHTRHSC